MRASRAASLVLIFLCGLILGAFALVYAIGRRSENWLEAAAARLTHRQLRVDISQPTVVAQVQRLARLESVTYTMDKVVEGDKELYPLPDFLVGDKLVLVTEGHAIAGVDLSKLKSSDVQVHEDAVRLHLPPAELLSVSLDEQKTHVYSRQTGLLAPADPNLESQVRAQAQQDLEQSALKAGILGTASRNACSTVTALLLGLGFRQVQCD